MSQGNHRHSRSTRVEPHEDGQRADLVAAHHWPDISRRQLRGMATQGRLRADERIVRAGDRVAAGQHLTLDLQENVEPHASSPTLVHATEHVLFVAKPSSWHSVSLRPQQPACLQTWLLENFPEQTDVPEAGLLHRLDYETSGLVAVARSPRAYDRGRAAFSEHGKIGKFYLAWISAAALPDASTRPLPRYVEEIDKNTVVVTAPVGPGSDATRVAISPVGRPARSRVELVGPREDAASDQTCALLLVNISSGVRHQIRVHLAYLGSPITGDRVYGAAAGDRMYLHAAHLDLRAVFGTTDCATYLDDDSFWSPTTQTESRKMKELVGAALRRAESSLV